MSRQRWLALLLSGWVAVYVLRVVMRRMARTSSHRPIDDIRAIDPDGLVLNTEEFEQELERNVEGNGEMLNDDEVPGCHRMPGPDGVCPSEFVLRDDCCVVPDATSNMLGVVQELAIGIATDLVLDSVTDTVSKGVRALTHADDAAKYIDEAAKALDDVAKNLNDVGKLDDAVQRLDDAASKLKNGSTKLDKVGQQKLADAVKSLDDAAKNLDDAALKRLQAATKNLDEAVRGLDQKTVKAMNKTMSRLDALKTRTTDAATRVTTGAADDAARAASQTVDEAAKATNQILSSTSDEAARSAAQQADEAARVAQAAAQEADEATRVAQSAVQQADDAARAAAQQADESAQVVARQADEATQIAVQQADEVAQAAAQQADEAARVAVQQADDATRLAAQQADEAVNAASNAVDELARVVSETGDEAARAAQNAADNVLRAATNAADNAASAATQAVQNVSDNVARGVANQTDNAVRLVARAGASEALEAAAQVSARTAAKVTTRISTKIGLAAGKLATRAATFASKMSNPVGWVLAAFDVVSMILDILNVGGYDNYVSNEDIENIRNMVEVQYSESVRAEGSPYPVLFPIDVAFPIEYAAAVSKYIEEQVVPVINEYIDASTRAEIQRIVVETEDDQEPDFPDSIDTAIDRAFDDAMNRDPKARDEALLGYLRAELTEDAKGRVARYPNMSTKERVGVSLSEAGVQWWYESHRMDWLRYNDFFIPIASTAEDIPVALFTDRYRVVDEDDPGDASNPNVVEKYLDQKLPLTLPMGHVVSFCEKYKNTGLMGSDVNIGDTGVDPHEFGVRFNTESGVCKFTNEWCQRMGMELHDESYVNHAPRTPADIRHRRRRNTELEVADPRSPFRTDCHLPPGQAVAEFLVGTTVTRGIVRAATGTDADILFDNAVQRRSSNKTGQCDAGMMCSGNADCGVGQKCLPSDDGPMACSHDECYPGGFWLYGIKRPACPRPDQSCIQHGERYECTDAMWGGML